MEQCDVDVLSLVKVMIVEKLKNQQAHIQCNTVSDSAAPVTQVFDVVATKISVARPEVGKLRSGAHMSYINYIIRPREPS